MPCGQCTLTSQFYERWPSTAMCILTGLGNIWYSKEDIQAAKLEFPKNLVSYYVWLYLMLWYGSLKIPIVTQAFVLCRRSLRSLFHAYALFCRANIIGSRVTQPKIARIISIVSGVLWWQYAPLMHSHAQWPRLLVDTICGVHILRTTFWRVFDSLHCVRLTEISAQGGWESALELFSVLSILVVVWWHVNGGMKSS